jgi:glycosyltransferase involved in cell wall biosynthesis
VRKTLTIVIPVYNMAGLLPRCLDAIKSQTRIPDCVLIIDDHSVDGSLATAIRYATGHQQFDVLPMPENAGVVCRMNDGLEMSETDYIYFAAADDRIEPRFVETLMAAAESNPDAPMVHCRSIFREVETGFAWKAGSKTQPASNATIFKTSALKELGGFDTELKWHSDWMACQGLSSGAIFVPEVIATANIHADGYCSKGRNSEEQKEVLARLILRCAACGVPIRRLCIFGWPVVAAAELHGGFTWPVIARCATHSLCVTAKNCLAWLIPKLRFTFALLVALPIAVCALALWSIGCLVALCCRGFYEGQIEEHPRS